MTIKIRNDVSGTPATTNLDEFLSTVTAEDSVGSAAGFGNRLHTDFAGVLLGPGSYFIGTSGTSLDIEWDQTTTVTGLDEWELIGENA